MTPTGPRGAAGKSPWKHNHLPSTHRHITFSPTFIFLLILFLCADVLTCGSNPLFSVHCKLELYNPEVSCRPICFLDRGGEHLHQFYWTISSLCGCFILLSKSIPRPADLQVSSAHQVCSPMSKALHPEFQGCLNPGEQMSSTSFIFTNYL